MQVAVPHLKPRILPSLFATGKNLPLEMLRAGWGSVYEQAGAEYGARGVEEFLRVQSEAQYVLSPHTYRYVFVLKARLQEGEKRDMAAWDTRRDPCRVQTTIPRCRVGRTCGTFACYSATRRHWSRLVPKSVSHQVASIPPRINIHPVCTSTPDKTFKFLWPY